MTTETGSCAPARVDADALRGLPGRPILRARTWRPGGDGAALATLVAIILAAVGFRFEYDNWLAEWDILSFFLPNYGYVGDRIRSFEVPAWNPYFSSGTPMAGDAGGGWMYLPVMVAFSLFPAAAGMKAMVLLQALIGGVATYILGRRLGLVPLAALLGATTFAVGPALYDATGQATVIGQVSAFIPVGIVGAEYALHAPRRSSRLAWSGLAGVALVQMFAAWPQGFLYGAMLVGGWFAYRGCFAQPPAAGSRRLHLGRTAIAGLATGAFAAAFGAAAILPRLDFSAQSTIPGGDYSNAIGGWYVEYTSPLLEILSLLLRDTPFWRIVGHSGAVLLLALLAILLGPNRYGAPFFAVSSLVFIDLAATESVTRAFFYLLPPFERVYSHRPTATIYMIFLPLAILAGAGVQLLLTGRHRRSASLRKLLPLPILLLTVLAIERAGYPVGWLPTWVLIGAAALIVLPAVRLGAAWQRAEDCLPRIAAVGLLVLSLVYPTVVDFRRAVRDPDKHSEASGFLGKDAPTQRVIETSLARHDPGSAAELLQRLRATGPPFRYAAFFGTGTPGTPYVPSSAVRLEPAIGAILANARAARLGLEEISGYNPLHLKHYAEYSEAMNGARQDYHWLDVHAAALGGSQLFDMLNVRYVLVPAALPHDPPIAAYGALVYRDDLVVVYENPHAFPRAWLVHEVRPNNDGAGLDLLSRGAVDGRAVAFIDGPLPPTSVPAQGQGPTSSPAERVDVTSHLPETITIRSISVADGLLVVSGAYARGWNAYVDGAKVDVLRTNHALRGVPLAAGDHTVALKYEPRSLTIGLWVTGAATLTLAAVWFWALVDRRRGDRGQRSVSGG